MKSKGRNGTGAVRCPICLLNFPATGDYDTCPTCDEPTRFANNITAMPADEAKSILAHARFERFLEASGQL
jgi:hypothetical protein